MTPLEDGLGADEHHLASRHGIGDGGVLDHGDWHGRGGERLRRRVPFALGVRLRHHHREVARLRRLEQQRDHHARVALREDDAAGVDEGRPVACDL